MNRIRRIRKRSIGTLIVLLFVLSFSITPALLFSNYSFGSGFENPTDEEQNTDDLNLSTNYLFKGTSYTFNLDNFYDDANLYKAYTGAKFQTEAFNQTSLDWSGVVNNDTVTPVDNDEIELGDPSNINMIKGTTDSADNMKINDASYTTFTSTHTDGWFYETPDQWDNFTFTEGTGETIGEIETIDADFSVIESTVGIEEIPSVWRWITGVTMLIGTVSGTILNAKTDDGNYFTLTPGNIFDDWIVGTNIVSFNIAPDGSAQDISYYIWSSSPDVYLQINEVLWKTGNPHLNADDQYHSGVTSVDIIATRTGGSFTLRVYYFRMDSIGVEGTPAELDVQVDMQVDNPDLSSIEYFKYSHKTNVSATIDLDIWNWDTSVWYEIESVDNFASFDDDSFTLGSGSDYISGTNQVRIRFQANTANTFQLLIDRFRLDYLTTPAELEMTITFSFANYNEDLLAMTVQSWQKTNISHTITFKIWNYDTESYVQISSSSDTTFTKKEYNTESPSNFISPTGTVKLYWVGLNITNNFELHIDYLFIQIFYKLDLVHEKSFDTNGIYRYRWVVLGSVYYTQWVVFEVVDPEPNFHAISESDVTTRWILQGSDISAVEDFNDDISGSNWYLYGVSNPNITISEVSTDDTFVGSLYPNNNYKDWVELFMTYAPSDPSEYRTFIRNDINYLTENYTQNSSLYIPYFTHQYYPTNLSVYEVESFTENQPTWNNQPSEIRFLTTNFLVATVSYIDLGLPVNAYKIQVQNTVDLNGISVVSSEYSYLGEYWKRARINHYLTKNYQGSGYMYMQTNTTELISLRSTDYGTHYTLSSGDFFEVDFQTNSDSLINLILLKDGVVNKTLTLSQSGNTNFNRHTVQISVDEDVEFDQLKISSTFEDTDNVKVYDIKTKKYTLIGDSADFYVSPNNQRDVYLTPDTYNLRIYEWGDPNIKLNENITIGSTDYYKIYTPTEKQACKLTLYSTSEPTVPLIFDNYHVSVNRSLNGQYGQIDLVEPVFYVDVGTTIDFNVYDRFDNLINAFEDKLADSYIALDLDVFQLEIINLMLQKTTMDINGSHIFEIASTRWVNFMLSKQYYQIGYYNPSNIYTQFIIYLDSNQVYELNMSRICNLYYTNQRMEPLSFYQFKTYINGTRIINNMFYATDGEHKGIEVKDLSDISVLNHTYVEGTEELNQISLILTQYSLKVMNQQEQFNHINITRDPNYYESGYYWSEWIAPNEIIKFRLFPGYYKINLTDNEGGSYSFYEYTLNGDDILLISSDNILSQVIYNIANVNTTIGNQITNVEINITNQNSEINNTVVNIEINLSNVNSTLGDLLTNIDVNILNLESDIDSLYTFTNTSIWNLDNAINNSFIYLENNIYSINQSISTLVIGIDNSISLVNATINSMFTEMSNQFIVVQSTLNYSFSFLNQTIIQLANNITENHIVLYNLIEQRANEIDSSLIDVQTLINLVNNTVADESLVIQTLVNLIGANITNNHIIINNLLNLIDNNITNNNIQLVSILEVIGNNITTNHFVIQTLLDVIGNNITYNHIELLTNLNLINTTISQNQIELINRLLFINNTMNDVMFELTNQLLFLNGTIYSAVLNLSTSVEFGVDMVIGNITLTYQQNEFLTELYKQTMFSQLLNWSGVAYNYTLMEDRIDVWTFINNYKNQSIEIHLRYQDLIEKLVISADDSLQQYLPNEDVEYRLWSVADEEYLDEWEELDPDEKTVDFGFYEAEVPSDPLPQFVELLVQWLIIGIFILIPVVIAIYAVYKMKISDIKDKQKVRAKGTNPISTAKTPYY